MIYTVTLNPAFDKTIYLDELIKGHVNRSVKSIMDIGGKGINVSKVIKSLGGESIALGFIGDENKDKFIKCLNSMGIKNDLVFVAGETRTNIKIVETKANIYTDINQRGFSITPEDLEELLSKLRSYAREGDIFVLSGSLPAGVDNDVYMNLINILKEKGAIIILDADGEALKNGLAAKPDIVKPNINELRMIYEFDDDFNSIVSVGREIIKQGVKKVIISMGNKGAFYIIEDEVFYAKPQRVEVKSTVGAGDSMVAAISFGISKYMEDKEIFKLAVSSATAAIIEEGTKAPSRENVDELMKKVSIERWM
ncbi:Tagatose-6-phosphate kinase [Caloramator mitchellensis]|uniref:Tagatose-6-phosphate kinase n=1 Tax=Caloramator mitchellensis TaxID=908809 RepID=A0A0R3JV58_CALMK|nr:1-phosphofructokinase [Caloramator mitchellensis]KRQ86157.1 Tagatose-6-phosphate kinase [Caloramator mitchellensis]